MEITFRQGIITAQTNKNFIQLVSGKVNINVDYEKINLAFAYGSHDYLFTEYEQVIGAWIPSATDSSYLYWDINLISGVRTFGITNVEPTYGPVYPTSPTKNQHFFDTVKKKMMVYNGAGWDEKLRVFAGYVTNGAVLHTYSLGSQVGLTANVSIGYILYNSSNNPIKCTDGGSTYFLTTTEMIHSSSDIYNSYKLDSLIVTGTASEPIPAYSCVTWTGANKALGIAENVISANPCIGLSVESFGKGETKRFVTKGFVTNYNNWNFSEDPNTYVFVGQDGSVTTTVPTQYSLQRIGYVVDSNTIFLDIGEQIILGTIPFDISPTPTPSPSVTPTPTPTP